MESGQIYTRPAPTPQAPNNNKMWLVGLGAVVVILAIIGILAPRAKKVADTPTPTPTRSETPISNLPVTVTGTVTTDPLPGWQTFNGNEFSLRYPTAFKASPYKEVGFAGVLLESSTSGNTASGSANLTLKITSLPNSAKSARDYANDQVKLENLPASAITSLKFLNLDSFEIPLKGEWGRGKILFFQNGSTVYRLASVIAAPLNTIAAHEATINQILSTFLVTSLDPERSK